MQKLDNARRLRGIYFIDPEEKEFKETLKNARRKLETPMAPAMPCKKNKHGETRGKTIDFKSKLRVSWNVGIKVSNWHFLVHSISFCLVCCLVVSVSSLGHVL